MSRLLLAGVLVMGTIGVAAAGPTRKVKVETTPPGASVYIDSVENGAACDATPCTIDAPLGQPTLIVRLDKHQPEFMPLDVPKGKKPLSVSIKLKGAIGTLVIDSPRGASVRVNDEDQGKVPVRADVPAEMVRVVVTMGGKTLYDDFVEVETGGEVELDVKSGGKTSASGGDDDDDDDGNGDDDDSDDGDDDGGSIGTKVEPAARAHLLQAGLAFDVGFRRFVFSDGSGPFANSGEVLLGPAIEVWPGRLFGVHLLRNLSLFGRVQFGLNPQRVTRETMGTIEDIGASTSWGAIEVSLRNKWTVADVLGLELGAGYVRDQVDFTIENSAATMAVPSADYRSIRIGVRVSYASTVEPYFGAEHRFVQSGGDLATRADTADTSGYRLGAGVVTKLGPLGARVEGSYAQYSWTFRDSDPTPPGASDKLFGISLVLGYQY